MQLNSVVFPAPLGPMTAQTSPRATARSTPATATKPSKTLRTRRTSSTPGPLAAAPDEPGFQEAQNAAGEEEEEGRQDQAKD